MAEGKANGGGFSLQLGAGKPHNAKRKVRVSEEDERKHKELVTSYGENGLVSASGQGPFRTIANQGNSLRGLEPSSRKKERFVPQAGDIQRLENGADRFEIAAPDQVTTSVQYGLNLMRGDASASQPAVKQEPGQEDATSSQPALKEEPGLVEPLETANGRLGNASKSQRVLKLADWEGETYKRDMTSLPDAPSAQQYEDMPVENFGAAMLHSMGWDGSIDNNQAQAVNYVRRPKLLGLGASPAMPTHEKKGSQKGEKSHRPGAHQKKEVKDLVVYDSEGRIKHTMREGDKLEERRTLGPAVGKQMRILDGRHKGLRCKVLTINDKREGRSQTAEVMLQASEEIVSVRLKELGELDQKPLKEQNGTHKSKHHSSKDTHRKRDREEAGRVRDSESDAHVDGESRPQHQSNADREELGGKHENDSGNEPPWLAPHIRVKVIDKALGRGRFYLKKAEITDVMSPYLCSLHLDSGDRIDVRQDQIETSIPRAENTRVLILLGPYKRRRAKMLQKSSETSQAALQLTEDYSVVKCSFDEFAEYVGPLGEEE